VNQKSGRFEPDKFEDQYETALVDLINQKRAGKPITPKERPRGQNVVDLIDALRKSVGGAAAEIKAPKNPAKKPRKAAAGQKEMLMPISGRSRQRKRRRKSPRPGRNVGPLRNERGNGATVGGSRSTARQSTSPTPLRRHDLGLGCGVGDGCGAADCGDGVVAGCC
jgi:hypothetical protein